MNLIDHAWLPFRHRNGERIYAPPTAVTAPELIDVAFPRADLNGAGWQFLIGLLQTTLGPANRKEWLRLWQGPPSRVELEELFAPWRRAFPLLGEGPRFLQDRDPLDAARTAPIASLLIEAPGDQGIKLNTDHFVKRGVGETMCPSCAAIALFSFQTTGPAGGTGYRVGIRGGGPLSTLVLPRDPTTPIWNKLLLNILTRDNGDFRYPDPDPNDWRVFPWLGMTRTSEKGSSTLVTTPDDVHPLHVYWAMPNRIRLGESAGSGTCQVCGHGTDDILQHLQITNLGYNYDGPFRHPLTPYRFDPKNPDQPPFSIKGQQGGLGYRHWEPLTLEDRGQGQLPALVVQDYLKNKRRTLHQSKQPRLWVFGYDLKQNKPRGWYSTEMPLVAVPPEHTDLFLDWVRKLDQAGDKAARRTQDAVKSAWFSRPRDAKGDFDFIRHRFWESTTGEFYSCLAGLAEAVEAGRTNVPPELARRWVNAVSRAANDVFESLALAGDEEAMDLKRVITARNGLRSWLSGGKEVKTLRQLAEAEQEATT